MVMDLQPIGDFFAGETVLLTGATGFLGRIALEKLLRACPDVRRVYVLVRGKRGKDCAARLEEVFASPAFARLAAERPAFRARVHLVAGDCALPGLALRPDARDLLVRDVSVILHWAATVNFEQDLKTATSINVRALRDLMRMAREMPHLKAFVHVSTVFAQCVRRSIDELYYGAPMAGGALIRMMDALDERTAAQVAPALLGRWPNTYVFTKAVAEALVRDEGRGLPIGVLRPSIVLASYREPLPGWIDNVYGATGVLLGTALGLIRVLRTDLRATAEMIPADYVVNTALAAAVDIARNHRRVSALPHPEDAPPAEAMPIYNAVSSTLKAIDWGTFMRLANKHCVRVPSPKIVWHCCHWFVTSRRLYAVAVRLLHVLPAHIVDALARCVGRKPVMVAAYRKIHKFTAVLAYFSTRDWRLRNDNVQRLWIRMGAADRAAFDFNMGAFDWDDYFHHYVRGARAHLLRETLDTLPAGRRKMMLLRVAHYVLCGLLVAALYRLVAALVDVGFRMMRAE